MVEPCFIALEIVDQIVPFQIVGFNNENEKRIFTNSIASISGAVWADCHPLDAFDVLINKSDYVGIGCYIQSMDILANLERKAHAAYNMLMLGRIVGVSTLSKPIPVLGFPGNPIGSNNAH